MAFLRAGKTLEGAVSQTELDAFTGSTNIATLGTVGTGTWEGTTVAVNQGGTGAATHTANNVLIGAGTSAITSIAPGADGQVLTSTGSAWQSEAVAGGVSETTGTWSPANNGSPEAWSTSSNSSTYVKHGQVIHLFCSFVITGGEGEYMYISGLPEAQASGCYSASTPFAKTYKAGETTKHADLGPSSDVLRVLNSSLGSQGYGSNFTTDGRITFSISYKFA